MIPSLSLFSARLGQVCLSEPQFLHVSNGVCPQLQDMVPEVGYLVTAPGGE